MTTKLTPAEKDEKMAAAETKSEARAAAAEEKAAEKAAAKEEALAAEVAAAPIAEGAPLVAPNDLAVNAESLLEEASDVETVGNPDTAWKVVAKASSKKGGWTKITRRMAVSNGAIYQTETTMTNPDGSYALSQATVFVPA